MTFRPTTSLFIVVTLASLQFVALCQLTSALPSQNQPVQLEAGQFAPDFNVLDMNGHVRRLRDLRGQKSLLLTFFPKCFTFNCTNQLQSLRDVYPDLQKGGLEVWGVSTDPAGGKRGQLAFAKHLRLPFLLLPDASRTLSLRYGTVQNVAQMAIRESILIGKDGRIKWIDKQINPRTHGVDVLKRVREEAANEQKVENTKANETAQK